MFGKVFSIVVLLFTFSEHFGRVDAQEVRALSSNICYPEYGCFTTAAPFGLTLQRPFALLPDAPEVVDTRFILYTRGSGGKGEVISRRTSLGQWDRNKATKILVHGFLDTMNSTWWPAMKDALLQVEDCNVIFTDWSRANYFPYTKATANAQIVGADIALLVNEMIKKHGVDASQFHIIAHSLGCAVAGYAGSRISQLGRITGLDPAGPFFEHTDPIVRLDRSDAKFVDIIHTDGSPNLLLGFGTLEEAGHVDFYPNGGMDQPSCAKTTVKAIQAILNLGPLDILAPMNIQGFFNTTLCSHFVAVHLFTNSILNRCTYRGFACNNDQSFQEGQCLLNKNEGNFLGYHASPKKALGRLYLNTLYADRAPFCVNHYQVRLVSSSNFLQTKGQFRLTMTGSEATENVLLDFDETPLRRDSVESRLLPLKVKLGQIQRLNIQFDRTATGLSAALYSTKWTFNQIILIDGDTQTTSTFCPENRGIPIESGASARFSPC